MNRRRIRLMIVRIRYASVNGKKLSEIQRKKYLEKFLHLVRFSKSRRN